MESTLKEVKEVVSSKVNKIFGLNRNASMFSSSRDVHGQPPIKRKREAEDVNSDLHEVCLVVPSQSEQHMGAISWAWDNPKEAGLVFLRGYFMRPSDQEVSSQGGQDASQGRQDASQGRQDASSSTSSSSHTRVAHSASDASSGDRIKSQHDVHLEKQQELVQELQARLKAQTESSDALMREHDVAMIKVKEEREEFKQKMEKLNKEKTDEAKRKEQKTKSLKMVDFLRNMCPAWQVVEKSTNKDSAQFHLIDPADKLIVLVAHKKEAICQEDLEHFESCLKGQEDERCMGAVFVSVSTRNIPRIGSLCVEHMSDMPALFAGFESASELQDELPHKLSVFLQFCKTVYALKPQEVDNEEQHQDSHVIINSLFEAVTDCFKTIKNSSEQINKLKLNHEQIGETIEVLAANTTDTYEKLEEFLKANNKLPKKTSFSFLKPW